jgi:hypothetical protein
MNKLIENIQTELTSLKNESYYLQIRITELEDALKLATSGNKA